MVKYTGRGLVVKRPGVLSKVQMLTLVLSWGWGSFPFFQLEPDSSPPNPDSPPLKIPFGDKIVAYRFFFVCFGKC